MCDSEEEDETITGCATYGGQCVCQEGLTGLECDACECGWFNFTNSGCQGMKIFTSFSCHFGVSFSLHP